MPHQRNLNNFIVHVTTLLNRTIMDAAKEFGIDEKDIPQVSLESKKLIGGDYFAGQPLWHTDGEKIISVVVAENQSMNRDDPDFVVVDSGSMVSGMRKSRLYTTEGAAEIEVIGHTLAKMDEIRRTLNLTADRWRKRDQK